MTYYVDIIDNKIACKSIFPSASSVEVSEEVYNNVERYIWNGTEVVLNPNYEQEQSDAREADFKSKFFNIPLYGWFRKLPKGYSSAVESLNTAFNAVTVLGQLPANMLIFYTAPDFTKPEQCTEEWLIEHQTRNEAMTAEQFGAFYMAFMQAWNSEEHE